MEARVVKESKIRDGVGSQPKKSLLKIYDDEERYRGWMNNLLIAL